MLAHTSHLCSRDVCRSTYKHEACTQTAFRKNRLSAQPKLRGTDDVRMNTHIYRAQERGVENRQQKGPKRPEAQPERLLAFLLQGERAENKGREVSRFSPIAGNPKKIPAKPQGTRRRGRDALNN